MRQLALALLFTAPFVAAAGCNKSNETNSNVSAETAGSPTLYAITAKPVTGSRASGINSAFRISKVNGPNADGIASDLSGGACILFRALDLGYTRMAAKSCNVSEDCDTGEGFGYCRPGTHQCWARAIVAQGTHDPLCNRSIDYSPPKNWTADTDVPISPDRIPVPAGLRPHAEALTLALLKGNGTPPQIRQKWGTSRTIP